MTNQCVHVGNTNMIDVVTGRSAAVGVAPGHAAIHGLAESPRELMVASSEKDRPTPSAAHVTDNRGQMDGPDPQEDDFRHGSGNHSRPTRDESDQARALPRYTGPANQCAAIKLPNGHVSCVCDARDPSRNCSCPESVGEVVPNGELLSDADAASSAAPSTSSILHASRPQSGHASPQDDEDEPSALRSRHRSSSSSSEVVDRTRDSETASNDCLSEAEPCFSQTLSSPEDSESCPDPAFVDVSLSSRNTYEISRRQSAPDNVADVAEPALRQKKHGISEIFGR